MTESKQIQQSLLSRGCHESDKLLEKNELLDKTSIYDLKKIPGVASSDSEDSNDLPLQTNKESKGVFGSTRIAPAQDNDEDDNVSQRSEDGYLPAMLRAAIPGGNKSQTFDVDAKDLCISPPLERNKKKSLSMRRTKSDKTKSLSPKTMGDDDILAQSLHSRTSNKSATEHELERLCKSEELKKSDSRKEETIRRKSETHLQRPPLSSRREKGRSRRTKEVKESTDQTSKPSSARRSKDKPPRSRSKKLKSQDKVSADKQVVEWKRTSKKKSDEPSMESEEQKAVSNQRKPKKSKSAGSNASKTKRSKPRETRSLSRSRLPISSKSLKVETTKGNKPEAVNRKGSSPRQLQRKRTQKQRQGDEKPPKSVDSPDDKPQRPRSRRTLMLTSKAMTPSCRDLLRKISKINDDRIKQNESEQDPQKPEPIIDDKPEPIDELSGSTQSTSLEMSRSTLSTSNSLTDLEDTNHTALSSVKPKEEAPNIPKSEEQTRNQKPPRTRSAPLRKVRKEKSNNTKINALMNASATSFLSAMSLSKQEKTNGSSEKRSVKKSLGDSLQKFGKMPDVKGSGKSKNGDDKTTRIGNRSKDKRNPLKPLTRSRSDSSLGLGKKRRRSRKRASTSQYDLMLSLHSTDEDYKDYEWDSDSDDDNSFSGEEVAEAEQEAKLREVSNKGLETSVKSLSPSDLIMDREETEDKAHKSKTFKFSKSAQRSKTFKCNESAQKSKTFKFNESAQKSKTFKFNESSQKSKTFKFTENSKHEEVKTEDCDDILSMAEFSEHAREPKKPPSCLQIDFSQLSEDGVSGDIVVRAKKLEKRGNRSNREL